MSDNNTESKSDWSKRELGALWKNQGRNQTYLTGHMKLPGQDEPVKVVVFSNRNKNKDTEGDRLATCLENFLTLSALPVPC